MAVSCSDDGDSSTDPSSPPVPLQTSIADGTSDVPVSTTQIVLTYDQKTWHAMSASITLNDAAIDIADLTWDETHTQLTVGGLKLDYETTYTLCVPKGAILSYDKKHAADELQLTFSTEVKPAEPDKPTSPTTKLCTANPSAGAQKLYAYLLSQYGQKVLSSTIANVNWNFDEAEMVYNATGKYPAIATMDYLHFYTLYADKSRNPYAGGWRVNYDDISEVKKWWDAGGIVSACWHWNVPNLEGQTSYTCKPGETTFRPRNIFVDGTWEKRIADEDLALIASLLKKLQEAGIPVIWRPLHEASGNSVNGGTAWFWWGIDGAETYVRLWRYMFDYFEAQGLNNLIWVWTTQTGYGWSVADGILSDAAWYPGDEYVDIVGRDEYTRTAAESGAEFEAISSDFAGKMVTLSECGSVAPIADQWAAGAKWSWFMPWYDNAVGSGTKDFDSHEHANKAWWQAAMEAECVISRDELPDLK